VRSYPLLRPERCGGAFPEAPPHVGALHHGDGDGESSARIPGVVHVVSAVGILHVDVVVLIPVVRPGFRPRVNETKPEAFVLEARKTADKYHGLAVDAEPVRRTEVAVVAVVRNAVAVVAAALLPVAVLGMPAVCAILLPGGLLFVRLLMLHLLRTVSRMLLLLMLLLLVIDLLLLALLLILLVLYLLLIVLLLLFCGVVLLFLLLLLLVLGLLLVVLLLLFCGVVLLLFLVLLLLSLGLLLLALRLSLLLLFRGLGLLLLFRLSLLFLFLRFLLLVLLCISRNSKSQKQKQCCCTDNSNWSHLVTSITADSCARQGTYLTRFFLQIVNFGA
jgi:hypothetical protein